MFQGTTIEELINSVERAEEHSRKQEILQASAMERQFPLTGFSGDRKWLR